jgi:hypothetical protein
VGADCVRTDSPAGFVAIKLGHLYVHQNNGRMMLDELLQRGLTVGRFLDIESGLLQGRPYQYAQRRVVIDNQYEIFASLGIRYHN